MEKAGKKVLVMLVASGCFCAAAAGRVGAERGSRGAGDRLEAKYCSALSPAPVLNSSDFRSVFGSADGRTVRLDSAGLMRELEFIAFPGTVFIVDERLPANGQEILRVRTPDYPYRDRLYIDSRFVAFHGERPGDRKRSVPPKSEIIKRILEMEGAPYLWGGNFYEGMDEMLSFYPPSGELDDDTRKLWRLEGVDCSGLLYQATNGYTPRNTSSLVRFGEPVEISGLCAERISGLVEPLDIIVWKGHVIIVLDSETVIESACGRGVVRSPLLERLESVMRARGPANEWDLGGGRRFLLRRWHE